MNKPAVMKTTISVVDEMDVDSALDEAIKHILVTCFPHREDVFGKARRWRGNVPLYNIVRYDADVVCAHIAVVERTIKVGDKQLRIAGVANVGVLHEYRGRRLVDGMLKEAMRVAQERDFDMGLLFTQESTKNVYKRNGWLEIVGREFIRKEDGVLTDIPPGSVKMYYPLKIKRFPPGTVDLLGDKF